MFFEMLSVLSPLIGERLTLQLQLVVKLGNFIPEFIRICFEIFKCNLVIQVNLDHAAKGMSSCVTLNS